MNMIEQMLSKYEIESENALINALKEIYQEIVLLGLYRGGFFREASFYGGTALRIIYGLERFSEDLDFSLLKKDPAFEIEKYFPHILAEFDALGIKMTLQKKSKSQKSDIESAFLKNGTSIHTLSIETDSISNILGSVHSGKKLKIKLEVDTNPPLKFQVTSHTLLLPTTFNITAMTLPNLYAGKLHALLYRNWKRRVKGRDWYDFEWYVKRGVKVNLEHLQERMIESGDFSDAERLTKESLKELLKERIEVLDVDKARQEVRLFVRERAGLDFWSGDYFELLVERMVF